MIDLNIKNLVETVGKYKPGSPLDKFISEAVFPNFKNLEPGTKIKFEFPLTAIVGPNGTGKSSILHALYGMPVRYSTSRFWFSTALDPIEEGGDLGVPRYYYDHWVSDLKKFVQTRKVRGRKRRDYWEPARVLESDGMRPMPPLTEKDEPFRTKERWNPTRRRVRYINFKCEFSAFDRYFYFPHQGETATERQERFLNGALRLKSVVKKKLQRYSPGGKNAVFVNRDLSKVELEWVSYILGREYVSARYILHELYGRTEAPSVVFQTRGRTYSEAFAGSGELAVVRAVMELVQASEFTLILLDEPETSLHPGAQVRLLAFMLEMIRVNKIQIVISTHSPTLIDQLPTRAIRALEDGPDGKARIVDVTHPQVAFNRIGQAPADRITLVVEDNLLESLVIIAMRNLDPGEKEAFQIFVPPGGASSILTYTIPALISENRRGYALLDGDQIPKNPIPKWEDLSQNQIKEIDKIIHEAFKIKPLHVSASNPDGARSYINWINDRLKYINAICPELVLLRCLIGVVEANNIAPTNQDAKKMLIKELEKCGHPSDAGALRGIISVSVPANDPHILHLTRILKDIIMQEAKL